MYQLHILQIKYGFPKLLYICGIDIESRFDTNSQLSLVLRKIYTFKRFLNAYITIRF